ncbi:MAG: ATP-binding cassette domain-containing protein [Methanospirillum sp.]|nr:ATP-binding cassette domain-containing protein [Methanospirillum sp.]
MTAIILERVVIERGPLRLEGDLRLGPGLHAVTGRVGSGKSTLALALAGGIRPAAGTVRLEGIGRRLWVGHDPVVHLTGGTVAAEVASWRVEPDSLLSSLGLADRARDDPFHLSLGMQKRLVLGCALAARADLLVLDEPFASLDLPARARLERALTARDGTTVVMTHADRHLPPGTTRWRIEGGRVRPEGP